MLTFFNLIFFSQLTSNWRTNSESFVQYIFAVCQFLKLRIFEFIGNNFVYFISDFSLNIRIFSQEVKSPLLKKVRIRFLLRNTSNLLVVSYPAKRKVRPSSIMVISLSSLVNKRVNKSLISLGSLKMRNFQENSCYIVPCANWSLRTFAASLILSSMILRNFQRLKL
jgi:hypothetical protein